MFRIEIVEQKIMKKFITAIAALAALVSCTAGKPKALVLYYSQFGSTEQVAKEMAAQLGADIASFDVVNPYDCTYQETIERCMKERSQGFVPCLAPLSVDLSAYDVVFLGYPIWFGTYAPPVAALLSAFDFSGKTIVPFCTFGSGGLNTSSDALKAALPSADVREGYGVRTARVSKAPEEIRAFLVNGAYIKGKAEVLEPFSAQDDVTAEQGVIFDMACSGYQMPLGSPVSCGSRPVKGGVEYLFTTDAGTQIHVLDLEDSTPEFTQVIR